MSYCTVSDITAVIPNNELIQITNDAGGSVIDTAKITDEIVYVDNVIDGYIRGRYSLPLTTVPDELKYLARDYVVYQLYSRRMLTEVPISVEQRFKNVNQILRDIRNRKYNLGVESVDGYPDPNLKTDKDLTTSTKNQYYNKDMWDNYGDGY